jgi:addiction module HigA family antidote
MKKEREYLVKEGDVKDPPIHPGEIIGEDVLPALNMSVAEAAAKMGVTRQTLHRIIAGQTAITPEMALRIGKFCGNGPDLWLNMQAAYDLWYARQKLAADLARIPTMEA